MAKRKSTQTKPETRSGEDIMDAEPGDFCYYLNSSNKVFFAQIRKVLDENNLRVLQIVCQSEYKHLSVPAKICAFDPVSLKGRIRHDLCPEVYNAK